jgi:hypothetical protein
VSPGSRRRLTALLATFLLGLAVAGCGQSSSQRPSVRRYVTQVNRIESELTQPLAQVTRAAANFSAAHGGSLSDVLGLAQQQILVQAATRIHTLRSRLAGLAAPAPALHLRALLLRLVDGQASVTREVTRLVVFLPRFQQALLPMGAATSRLEAALSQQSANGPAAVTAVFAAKAAALRSFRATAEGVAAQLRRLSPPAVSRPGYAAQLHGLSGMAVSAGRLADALVSGRQSEVAALLTQFDRAAASNQTAAVHRAEAAAARAYDSRIAALSDLSRSIDRERLRLANSLA